MREGLLEHSFNIFSDRENIKVIVVGIIPKSMTVLIYKYFTIVYVNNTDTR